MPVVFEGATYEYILNIEQAFVLAKAGHSIAYVCSENKRFKLGEYGGSHSLSFHDSGEVYHHPYRMYGWIVPGKSRQVVVSELKKIQYKLSSHSLFREWLKDPKTNLGGRPARECWMNGVNSELRPSKITTETLQASLDEWNKSCRNGWVEYKPLDTIGIDDLICIFGTEAYPDKPKEEEKTVSKHEYLLTLKQAMCLSLNGYHPSHVSHKGTWYTKKVVLCNGKDGRQLELSSPDGTRSVHNVHMRYMFGWYLNGVPRRTVEQLLNSSSCSKPLSVPSSFDDWMSTRFCGYSIKPMTDAEILGESTFGKRATRERVYQSFKKWSELFLDREISGLKPEEVLISVKYGEEAVASTAKVNPVPQQPKGEICDMSSKTDMLLMFSMMNGNQGGFNGINPAMLLLLGDDKTSKIGEDKDLLTLMLLGSGNADPLTLALLTGEGLDMKEVLKQSLIEKALPDLTDVERGQIAEGSLRLVLKARLNRQMAEGLFSSKPQALAPKAKKPAKKKSAVKAVATKE